MNGTFKHIAVVVLVLSMALWTAGGVLASGKSDRGGKHANHLQHRGKHYGWDIASLEEDTKFLRHGLHGLNRRGRSVRAQVIENSNRITELESKAGATEEELRALANQVNSLDEQIVAASVQTDANTAAIAAMQSQMDLLVQELATVEQTLTDLYNAISAEVAAVKDSLAAYKAESDAVHTQVQEQIGILQTKVDTLNTLVQDQGMTLEDLAMSLLEISSLVSQIVSLESAVNQNTTDILALQQEIAAMNGSISLNHVHAVHYDDWIWTPNSQYYKTIRIAITETGQLQ